MDVTENVFRGLLGSEERMVTSPRLEDRNIRKNLGWPQCLAQYMCLMNAVELMNGRHSDV